MLTSIIEYRKEEVYNYKRLHFEAEKLHTIEKHTPYDGMKVKGVPLLTMVRGEIIIENGEVIGKPRYGKFVTPSR